MRHGARRLLTLLLAVMLPAGAAGVEAQSTFADVLARAAAPSQPGQHAQAYALLAAEEDTHIGEIAFDDRQQVACDRFEAFAARTTAHIITILRS